MSNAFGLIHTGEMVSGMKDLTSMRAVAAVPIGGRYRVIDFPLSNLVNSGVVSVGLIAQRNYSSLMDHISGGDPWDLHRKNDGLFLLPPFFSVNNSGVYTGTVDALKGTMDYISHAPYKYCIFQSSHTVYNTTYTEAIKQHEETGADITFIYGDGSNITDSYSDVRLIMDQTSRVIDMEINTRTHKSDNLYMDCMIIDKGLLEYLVDEAYSRGYSHFVREMIFKRLDSLKVHGWKYDGYVARITDLASYYKANMDLLSTHVRKDLFDMENRIYTKVKDEVPAMYGRGSKANHSIVADGCVIEGSVEDCVIFRGVRIRKGAQLKGCIVMQGCEIQEGVQMENVILDKEVIVRRDRRIIGVQSYPVVIKKQSIV